MAGLVPAIHAFLRGRQVVDARNKCGHDADFDCQHTRTNESKPSAEAECDRAAKSQPSNAAILLLKSKSV